MSCPLCGGAVHVDADAMVRRCDRVSIERFPTGLAIRELWLDWQHPSTGPVAWGEPEPAHP